MGNTPPSTRGRGRNYPCARSDDTTTSDFDFLVEFEPGSSLLDPMDLQEALAALLAAPVDVVFVGGLEDRDEHIRREAIPI